MQMIISFFLSYLDDLFCGKEILIGDFKLSIRWNSTVNINYRMTPQDKLFFDSFTLLGLSQWIHEPTYLYSENILNLILASESDKFGEVSLCPPFPSCEHSIPKFEYFVDADAHPFSEKTGIVEIITT